MKPRALQISTAPNKRTAKANMQWLSDTLLILGRLILSKQLTSTEMQSKCTAVCLGYLAAHQSPKALSGGAFYMILSLAVDND